MMTNVTMTTRGFLSRLTLTSSDPLSADFPCEGPLRVGLFQRECILKMLLFVKCFGGGINETLILVPDAAATWYCHAPCAPDIGTLLISSLVVCLCLCRIS
jgi:hypothetical protein